MVTVTATGRGPAAALVRVPMVAGWAAALPGVLGEGTITCSTTRGLRADERAVLTERGYRHVGIVTPAPAIGGGEPPEGDVADLVVSGALPREGWQELTSRSLRVVSLAHGPALATLGDVLRLHRRADRLL